MLFGIALVLSNGGGYSLGTAWRRRQKGTAAARTRVWCSHRGVGARREVSGKFVFCSGRIVVLATIRAVHAEGHLHRLAFAEKKL